MSVAAARPVRRGARSGPTSRWSSGRLAHASAPAAGVALLLVAWQLVAVTVAAGRHVVPTIPEFLQALVDDGFYLVHVRTTLGEAALGFLWGNLAAFAVAGLCLLLPLVRGNLTRLAMATYSTPTIAIAPLLVVLFDPVQSKVVMAALSVFFPTLLGTLLGFERIQRGAVDFAYVTGASRWFVLTRLRLRSAVVPVASALSLAAPAAMVGAMIGEYLGGDRGLGAQLVQAQQSLNVARAWAVAVEATALSTLAYLLIGAAARRLSYTETTTELGLAPAGASGSGWRGLLDALSTVVVVLLLWWGVVRGAGLDTYVIKTPDQVAGYLIREGHAALILGQLAHTLADAAIGYAAGTLAAVVMSALFLSSPLVQGMFLPLVMTLRAVPLVALTPLIALVFGRGLLTVAVLAGAVTFVPTLVLLLASLKSVPRPALELAHVYGVGWWRTMFGIRLLYALPALAASARVAIPGSILGAVLVEILATGTGVGNVVLTSIGSSDYLALWSSLAVLSAVTAALYALLSSVESAAMRRLAS